jgi:hypothetical protein
MSHRAPSGPHDRLHGFDAWLLPIASRLVPMARRPDWTREWRAEFWHLRHSNGTLPRRRQTALDVLSLAWGMVADAAWVGMHTLHEQNQGTAQWCLYQLALACTGCAAAAWIYEGSGHALIAAFTQYFLHRFMLVLIPAIFVAIATMPRRPRKCTRGHAQLSGLLPAHMRWSLFLAAKIALSVLLAFLACVLVSIPVRRVFGHNGDWLDVLMSTMTVTASMRLALADQMQRCQRCLRLLRQPVRVGPPSYNLLNWSGTELVCAEGHGMLQVPEMQGSWCWYDLWVEVGQDWGQHWPGALSPEP